MSQGFHSEVHIFLGHVLYILYKIRKAWRIWYFLDDNDLNIEKSITGTLQLEYMLFEELPALMTFVNCLSNMLDHSVCIKYYTKEIPVSCMVQSMLASICWPLFAPQQALLNFKNNNNKSITSLILLFRPTSTNKGFYLAAGSPFGDLLKSLQYLCVTMTIPTGIYSLFVMEQSFVFLVLVLFVRSCRQGAKTAPAAESARRDFV